MFFILFSFLFKAELTSFWNPKLQRPLPRGFLSLKRPSVVVISAGLWHLAETKDNEHQKAIEEFGNDLNGFMLDLKEIMTRRAIQWFWKKPPPDGVAIPFYVKVTQKHRSCM